VSETLVSRFPLMYTVKVPVFETDTRAEITVFGKMGGTPGPGKTTVSLNSALLNMRSTV